MNFQKEDDSKLNIKINGFHEQDRLMKINSLIIKEKKNKFKIVDLTFDKRFKIKELKELELDYVDKENKKIQ